MTQPQTPQEAKYHARPEYAVPLDDAVAMLKIEDNYSCGCEEDPGPHVETLVEVVTDRERREGMTLTARWPVSRVRQHFIRMGVEASGDEATAAGYGLVSWRNDDPLVRAHPIYFRTG
jgi:hypothetical protein